MRRQRSHEQLTHDRRRATLVDAFAIIPRITAPCVRNLFPRAKFTQDSRGAARIRTRRHIADAARAARRETTEFADEGCKRRCRRVRSTLALAGCKGELSHRRLRAPRSQSDGLTVLPGPVNVSPLARAGAGTFCRPDASVAVRARASARDDRVYRLMMPISADAPPGRLGPPAVSARATLRPAHPACSTLVSQPS